MMKKLFLITLLLFSSTHADNREQKSATVAHIIDGDTFVTGSGEHVRLLGINTPERGRNGQPPEAYYAKAKNFLHQLIAHKNVTLRFGKKKKDKYKRLLAQVYLPDGTWVNAALIKAGMAHVYSFPDTAGAHTRQLLTLEEHARTQKTGLWALPRWHIKEANTMDGVTAKWVGQFNLVTGKVRSVADVKGRLYLNFGQDWRRDFTAEIRPQDRKKFRDKSTYMGKTTLVRGVMKPVNGMMVTLTHPEQLEVLQ